MDNSTIQQKAIDLYWSLDRDQTFITDNFTIIDCSHGFVMLDHVNGTWENFKTIKEAMDCVPEEDLRGVVDEYSEYEELA